MAKVPDDLEHFPQALVDQILCCGRSKRLQLIHAGVLVALTVGGKKLVTGKSLRAYLAECAANPQRSGRSLSALDRNREHQAKRRARAS